MATRDSLSLAIASTQQIDPYLPHVSSSNPSLKPYVTLTFATSLDSNLSLSPGTQTTLSGPLSKAMTHYLRSKHDAILIGVGTANADNPSLNCRFEGVGGYGGQGLEGQPRPVILDPSGRWDVSEQSKVIQLASTGRGRGPLVLTYTEPQIAMKELLEKVSGKFISMFQQSNTKESTPRFQWADLLAVLSREGITSVMVEGGGAVINDLLHPSNITLVNSVIVTIAPVWLGKGGVQVCPEERVDGGSKVSVGRLGNVKWVPLGDDVVLCGRPSV
ncbi:5-amino-6-uracil reductase-like protein [Amniculicola lignicola CBS 123094]|uniref:2,5-diamino-6-ribosylamino-4(3H)-pyrimidinone 5'-phosphate reductase n=1 Tax=Amniculicola lignicola CBS 123094 TaxID=1392246 RepID=A0A6A5WQG5_9PLEO|nr:5-amino-6-uracil reductase-like protein [Amniculicola lignicola CBS 123094]